MRDSEPLDIAEELAECRGVLASFYSSLGGDGGSIATAMTAHCDQVWATFRTEVQSHGEVIDSQFLRGYLYSLIASRHLFVEIAERNPAMEKTMINAVIAATGTLVIVLEELAKDGDD